jgi:hypothetical protein
VLTLFSTITLDSVKSVHHCTHAYVARAKGDVGSNFSSSDISEKEENV